MSEKKATQLSTPGSAEREGLAVNLQSGKDNKPAAPPVFLWDKGTGLHAVEQKGGGNSATGDNALSEGSQNVSSGVSSHSEGQNTISSGFTSHAEGSVTTASADYAHAEGNSTIAAALYAHAEGFGSQATAISTHAEGEGTIASGEKAHAEGFATVARGQATHAEGDSSLAMGNRSHAQGRNTIAAGVQSHTEGKETYAYGDSSHAQGSQTQANARFSHAEGDRSIAGNPVRPFSIDPNGVTVTIYDMDVREEFANGNPVTIFINSELGISLREIASTPVFAAGNTTFNINSAINSFSAEGFLVNNFIGENSHAQGTLTRATGISSHAQGTNTWASGVNSNASGLFTKASANNSYSGGQGTSDSLLTASGRASFNHSECTSGNVSDVQAANAAILAGVNNTVTATAIRSVLLGGSSRTETEGDYVNVPKLRVSTVDEYADNTAAVSAGLNIGAVYRTGDLLKIVH